ncbi:NCS1 family nucleobase:cation symporter-1 [Nocardia sp. CDC159]|uniref:NCS1 family nucleobase:cation symporter-1 n=1 Tax=Nocardia pulmonis TaxID=2951408 RepID=A0A9X2EHS0_9NOCA|nr:MULTISPECIES: NCS1 family nucleobase:cation symporter-1 [Nocardia]MCM6778468.1 NCS1 family nucleobase:cation symporter-1 [Nocardia pulmonis]MCM6791357.1 NCS1 family nucleobase:cation symporter-1 [Nocardia sp. CDC159]
MAVGIEAGRGPRYLTAVSGTGPAHHLTRVASTSSRKGRSMSTDTSRPDAMEASESSAGEQILRPDSRVELAGGVVLDDAALANDDLRPVPIARRRWTTYNFMALWVGMAHNVASWTLASGLIAVGMNWVQAVGTIAAANVVVLVPMLLTGHVGTKYGIPFPVFVRASFGVRGANLPALVRASVACAWFGIQSWIGGEAIFVLTGRLFGESWSHADLFGGYPWTQWVSFALFWVLQVAIVMRGMEALRRFENWAAPLVIVGAVALLIWIAVKAGGVGPLVSEPSKLGWGHDFWVVFFPSLMGVIGSWSTLSLNMPDFTRFGVSQRAQMRGQALGLPTTMTLFAFLAVLVTSGTQSVYGAPIWDPVQVAAKVDSVIGTLFALMIVLIATLSVNIPANIVSSAYDFANLAPRVVGFRTGALITCVVGVVIMPWKLIADPHTYIYIWLNTVGGLLGAVAGVLIADYWLVRRTQLVVADLYRRFGRYWYAGGWNWRAALALVVGALLAIGGSYSTIGDGVAPGPFPPDGLIPALRPLADYGWAVGLGSAMLTYPLLIRLDKRHRIWLRWPTKGRLRRPCSGVDPVDRDGNSAESGI